MTGISTELRDALALKGFTEGAVACVTGGADGIGRAAAVAFGALGMKVALVDVDAAKLPAAAASVSDAGAQDVITFQLDVADAAALGDVEAKIAKRWGGTDALMNNAGIQPGSQMFGPLENWQRIVGVNLWGVVNGAQVFAPGMIERGRPLLDAVIKDILGVNAVSLHTDISAKTGERVIVFTLERRLELASP